MKFRVNVDGRIYDVEINDLEGRPIRVLVDGEPFDVWPMEEKVSQINDSKSNKTNTPINKSKFYQNIYRNKNHIRSPIPGTILSVNIHSGDIVQSGQELCIIEAMKMKNVIRSTRDGTIKKVTVIHGQHVAQHDLLMEFEEV